MQTLVIITADTNDGDYVYGISKNVSVADLDRIKSLWEIVKAGGDEWGHNWITTEDSSEEERPEGMYKGKLTQSDIEFLERFFPYAEYGTHTIESIEIYTYDSEQTL